MEATLTDTLFEWLLAEWAGHGKDPGKIFPNLCHVNAQHLEKELSQKIKQAQLEKNRFSPGICANEILSA